MWRADSIKRAARKEAWYGDGTAKYNPFRKTTRSSSWAQPSKSDRDIERGDGVEDQAPLAVVHTEPLPESPRFDNHEHANGREHGHSYGISEDAKPEDVEMTKADGRSSEPTSDTTGTTVVEKQSTHQSIPEKKGLFNRFSKKGKENEERVAEPDDAPKKRPWYKGKLLKHKPFTLRNQLGATIFNSWINLLLIAAPVGIGLNYAGVNGKIVFVVNFIAIIPLAGMLSFATEEIALHVGESLGGLLNASFGYVRNSS
jgi:Ca2+:H+ antiporter